MLGFIAPLLLAKPLAEALEQRRRWRGPAEASWAALALAAVALVGVRLALPVVRHDGPTSPVSALEHVPPAISHRPLLNSYGFGGYLIYKGSSRSSMVGPTCMAMSISSGTSGSSPVIRPASIQRWRSIMLIGRCLRRTSPWFG
jgi:hypothetical protein